MSGERRFPVLDWSKYRQHNCPRSVPWSLLDPHEAQALLNHNQTLQRLAERGGLSPQEMVAVLRDQSLRSVLGMPDADAVRVIRKELGYHA